MNFRPLDERIRAPMEGEAMAERIKAGTILIKEGTALPECLQFESEHYSNGWRSVKNLDAHGLDGKIAEAGWTFFSMGGEGKTPVIGSAHQRSRRNAAKKLSVKIKRERPTPSN